MSGTSQGGSSSQGGCVPQGGRSAPLSNPQRGDQSPRSTQGSPGGAPGADLPVGPDARDLGVQSAARRGRDRDAAGRPQNARPRDGLGRPLPRSATTDTERIPDDLEISPAEAAELGASLLAQGRPFHAHEVFEATWKTGPVAERELWQGLAQIAVGITHARRGNPKGAASLLRRGADRVRDYPARSPYGIDTEFVTSSAEDIAFRIEQDGLDAVPEASLRFPLA